MSQILIFDRSGKQLAELDASCSRSWLFSDIGQAEFAVSLQDTKCKREFLEFGNLIFIEHEKLPAWGGVIDVPRKWRPGFVEVRAYSAEKILEYSIGPVDVTLSGSTGNLVEQILKLAPTETFYPILAGVFEDDGKNRQQTLNLTKLLEECQELVKRGGGEFCITPTVTNGILQFKLDYFSEIGQDTGFALAEGHNLKLSNNAMVEQGTICNDLTGFGEGASWLSKPIQRVVNVDSVAQYGRRQASKNFSGNVESDTLQGNTEQAVAVEAYPRVMLDLNVLDVGDVWRWMRLGNRFPLILHTAGFSGSGYGFSGLATVSGMEFDEGEQTVRVIFDSQEEE